MKRDKDDVRKINGKFTIGWNIVQIVAVILILVSVVAVFTGNIPFFYGSFAVLLVMAIIARIIRRRQRRLQQEGKI